METAGGPGHNGARANTMNNVGWTVVASLLFVLFYAVVPAVMAWGWVRWARRAKSRDVCSILSLVAFTLATASALLAVSSILYAYAIGGFPYFDPRLSRIYRWGFLLSTAAVGFAISGVWRQSALRWHAFVCGIGTLFFWISAAEGE